MYGICLYSWGFLVNSKTQNSLIRGSSIVVFTNRKSKIRNYVGFFFFVERVYGRILNESSTKNKTAIEQKMFNRTFFRIVFLSAMVAYRSVAYSRREWLFWNWFPPPFTCFYNYYIHPKDLYNICIVSVCAYMVYTLSMIYNNLMQFFGGRRKGD